VEKCASISVRIVLVEPDPYYLSYVYVCIPGCTYKEKEKQCNAVVGV